MTFICVWIKAYFWQQVENQQLKILSNFLWAPMHWEHLSIGYKIVVQFGFFFLFSEQDKDSSVLYLNHLKPVMVLGMQNVLWVLTLTKHDTCRVTHQPSPVTHSGPVNPLTQVRYRCSICVLRCQVTQSTGI